MAMLGNLQALGGMNRTATVWQVTPPSLIIVVPQRMTVNDQPSQFCHAWYVWNSHHQPTHLVWDDLTEGTLF